MVVTACSIRPFPLCLVFRETVGFNEVRTELSIGKVPSLSRWAPSLMPCLGWDTNSKYTLVARPDA
jgi:hypothetical protein